MLLISKILDTLNENAQNAIHRIIEAIRTVFEGDPQTRRQVAFSVAIIALSAKMAKADGIVTQDEINAFQKNFKIPEEEAKHVSRLYNLAKQDVAGYDIYARRLADLCGSGEDNCPILQDILDGLYHIAKADGLIHEKEALFLQHVSDIFRLDEAHFAQITARHIYCDNIDPFAVLGIHKNMPFNDIKKHYRELAKKNHPDNLHARGVPEEFLSIAGERMAKLNLAFETIEKMQVST